MSSNFIRVLGKWDIFTLPDFYQEKNGPCRPEAKKVI